MAFQSRDRVSVPAVTAEQMREVDRVALVEFGLGTLQMMENAGRNLAENVLEMLGKSRGPVMILAGSGGNGGGGLCCARHLHNRGFEVHVVVSRSPDELRGAARAQLEILRAAGVPSLAAEGADTTESAAAIVAQAELTIDALVGYSLRAAPRGRVAALIEVCNRHSRRTLSLDVPSGLDATSGQAPGAVVRPERTLTLALPKTGLRHAPGALYLADIGIPPEVYAPLGISFELLFDDRYWLEMRRLENS